MTPFAYLNAKPLPIVAMPRKVTQVTPEDVCYQSEHPQKATSIRGRILEYLAEHGRCDMDDVHDWLGVSRKSFIQAIHELRKQDRVDVENGEVTFIRMNTTPQPRQIRWMK